MPVPLIGAGVKLLGVDITKSLTGAIKSLPVLGGLLAKKSPRYGGGDGPLYSTVNGFYQRVYAGEIAVINQLNQLRRTDADKVQWQQFWDTDMLQAVTTAEQRSLIVRLDPTKAGTFPASGVNLSLTPGGATQVGMPLNDLKAAGDSLKLAGDKLADALPVPVKEAAEKLATAVGTTSSTVTIVAAVIGVVLVIKALSKRAG